MPVNLLVEGTPILYLPPCPLPLSLALSLPLFICTVSCHSLRLFYLAVPVPKWALQTTRRHVSLLGGLCRKCLARTAAILGHGHQAAACLLRSA